MKHTEWLAKVTNGASINAAANAADIVQRTLSRQLEREHIDAESVIKIAVAYKAHPVRALVDTGYLEPQYARSVDPLTALRQVPEEALANEVLERMMRGLETDALTTPVDELASRRSNISEVDVRGLPYAADDSDTEPEEGDDDYHDGP